MATLNEIFQYTFLGNQLEEWVVALAIFILAVSGLKLIKYVVLNRLRKISKKTKTDLDDLAIKVIDSIGQPFYMLIALYFSAKFLILSEFWDDALDVAMILFTTFYATLATTKVIDYVTKKLAKRRREVEGDDDTSLIKVMGKLAKGALWTVAFVFLISNLGYDVSTLIAGLGVGGIAIAFALQNILSDIFASFSIYFDKPFKVGDFIIIGTDMGTVKHIGIKTTRIQTLHGQELIISNKELTSTRINNYKRMDRRRIQFAVGVTYQTSASKMRKLPKQIWVILEDVDKVTPDRVHFKEFGDFSLRIETVYYVESSDYNVYMDVQQEINLKLMELFKKEKVEFAYPTQTVFVEK